MSGEIAVLIRRFPKLSKTFILGEISNLTEMGLNLKIFSLQRPNAEIQQPGAALLLDRVTYIDEAPRAAALMQLLRALLRKPALLLVVLRAVCLTEIRLAELAALIYICNAQGISHVHAHYISGPALLADLAAQLRDSSFSVSAHAKDIYLTDAQHIRERIDNASFVSTCTGHNHAYLAQLTDRHTRLHLIYHGIDSKRFRPAEAPAAPTRPLIVAVGRYKEKKGFDLLIHACAILRETGMPLRCDIIGYGEQQTRLQNLIDAHRLQADVRLVPPVDHDQLADILRTAAICVLPCRQTADGDRDGIPNALLEAMACEVPIVSTTVSGIPEVVNSGSNGLLVEPDDAPALAASMQSILGDHALGRAAWQKTAAKRCGRNSTGTTICLRWKPCCGNRSRVACHWSKRNEFTTDCLCSKRVSASLGEFYRQRSTFAGGAWTSHRAFFDQGGGRVRGGCNTAAGVLSAAGDLALEYQSQSLVVGQFTAVSPFLRLLAVAAPAAVSEHVGVCVALRRALSR